MEILASIVWCRITFLSFLVDRIAVWSFLLFIAATQTSVQGDELHASPEASVVQIQCAPVSTETVFGTAVCVHEDGLFVTCAHIVQNCNSGMLRTSSGAVSRFRVSLVLPQIDLAILESDGKSFKWPTISGIAEEGGQPGEPVRAIGNLEGWTLGTYSGSIVAANMLTKTTHCTLKNAGVIQCPVGPGDSGGAVFDMHGNLLGIIVGGISNRPGLVSVLTVKEIADGIRRSASPEKICGCKPLVEFSTKISSDNTKHCFIEVDSTTLESIEDGRLFGKEIRSSFDLQMGLVQWSLRCAQTKTPSSIKFNDSVTIPVAEIRSKSKIQANGLKPGLEYSIETSSGVVQRGTTNILASSHSFPGLREPIELRIHGYLRVKDAGSLRVYVEANGRASLRLGDQITLDFHGDESPACVEYGYFEPGDYEINFTCKVPIANLSYAIKIDAPLQAEPRKETYLYLHSADSPTP
jgi:S1-C subfamily serine protease